MQFLTLILVSLILIEKLCDGFVVPNPAQIFRFAEDASESRNYPVFSGGLDLDRFDDDVKLLFPESRYPGSRFASSGLARSRISGGYSGGIPGSSFRGSTVPGSQYDDSSELFGQNFGTCYDGEVLNLDGSCERPLVSRNFFLYAAPQQPLNLPSPPPIPKPKVNYNVVFIRNPDHPKDLEPIVVPPPLQKTLVYVLNKVRDVDQDIIEVPQGPVQRPEVFYVNYDEGENPQLPFGLDLQTALASIEEQGTFGGGSYGGRTEPTLHSDVDSLAAKINAAAQLKAAAGALKNEAVTSLTYGGGSESHSTGTKIFGPSKP